MLCDTNDPIDVLIKKAKKADAFVVSPHFSLIKSRKDVEKFQSLGYRVIVYTANDERDWQSLIHSAVDGIITDHPTKLVNFLRSSYAELLLRSTNLIE